MNLNIFSGMSRGAEFLSADLSARGGCANVFMPDNDAFSAAMVKELIVKNGGMAASPAGDENDSEKSDKNINIFLIKEDEKENLLNALTLKESIADITAAAADAGVRIYVFSSSDIARTVLDSCDFGNADLFLVDPVETAVWNLMLEHPLYEMRDKFGDEELRILIVGSGPAIPQIIKTVYWCGRMRLFRMKMNMIGGDMKHIETEMKLRCPGLFTQTMQENLDMRERGLIVPELYLPLRLTRAHYLQAETDTEEFEIALNKCLDSNYIIIDEGDDEATLRTAMAVRAHFIRKHILSENFLSGGDTGVTKLPGIYVHIRDERLSAIVPSLTVEGHPADAGHDELAFVPFGSVKSVYRAENVTDDPLDTFAEALFPKEFSEEAGEGNEGKYISGKMPPSIRRMLRASALHLKYKLRDMNMIVRGDAPDIYNADNFPEMRDVGVRRAKEVEQNFKFEMTALEHQCWTVFRLADGWIPADAYHALGYGRLFEDGHREHRQFAGKMSAACVESSALSGTGTKMYGSPSHFTEYDRETAAKTCAVLKAVCPETEFAELVRMEFDD